MIDIQNYGSFIAAIVIFQMVPGAGTIAILNATARDGRAGGLAAVAGTLCGDTLFMVAAVAGLAAVMQANPVLFHGLQWFGAAYLCWIGLQLVRSKVQRDDAAGMPGQPIVQFRRALAVSLTNPKVILFFVSFFPLFVTQDASTETLVLMMVHVIALSLAYQTLLVLAGACAAARLRSLPSARLIATRLAGVALVAFGIKLAASNR